MSRSIFISIPWFTPAYKAGGPIQSVCNMLMEMKEGYHFYIFTGDADWDGQPLQGIQRNAWTDYNENTQVWYAGKKGLSDTICKQIEMLQPDILFIIGLFDWHFNLVPLYFAKHPRKLLSVRGMLHPGALRQKSFKKSLFLKGFTLSKKQRQIRFHATDEIEAGFIRDQFGADVKIGVAANFPRMIEPLHKRRKTAGSLKLISIALISPMKNQLLVLQSLALMDSPVEYEMYGTVKDYAYWQECLQCIRQLPAHIRVRYQFDLPPSEVPGKLHGADVAILPSESENFGHSIIEALSAGLPVISSHGTIWNGLKEARAGINLGRNAEEMVQAIRFFQAMDETEFYEWQKGAAQYARQKIDREAILHQYVQLFAE